MHIAVVNYVLYSSLILEHLASLYAGCFCAGKCSKTRREVQKICREVQYRVPGGAVVRVQMCGYEEIPFSSCYCAGKCRSPK